MTHELIYTASHRGRFGDNLIAMQKLIAYLMVVVVFACCVLSAIYPFIELALAMLN